MLKRLLVLAVMLCLLLVAFTERSASATAYCGCGVYCGGGGALCEAVCDGGTAAEQERAARACCQRAFQITPVQCVDQ